MNYIFSKKKVEIGDKGFIVGDRFIPVHSEGLKIPEEGLIFYASLKEDIGTAQTGQILNKYGNITYQNINDIMCGKFYDSMITFATNGFPNNQVTISAWYYRDSNAGWDRTGFFGYGAGGGRTALLENQYGIFCLEYDGGRVSSDVPIPQNVWVNLVVVIGVDYVIFYMNGQKVATKNYSANINPANGMIGALNYYYMCTCYISATRIYNRELSQEQIAILSKEFEI